MKIVGNLTRQCNFSHIIAGYAFVYNDRLYVKAYPASVNAVGNAVDLETGGIRIFPDSCLVDRREVELVMKG